MGSSQSKAPGAEAAVAEQLIERVRALEIEESDNYESERDFVYVGQDERESLTTRSFLRLN